MDINLKNRYVYWTVFIISIYLFAVAILSSFDFIKYREFAAKNFYYKSYHFTLELLNYFEGVEILVKDNKEALQSNSYYESIKNKVDSKQTLRYYMKDRNSGEIYTNINETNDIEDYINQYAIHVEKFPKADKSKGELEIINKWFKVNNYEGSLIFIKTASGYSKMENDYIYYNSIRERVILEAILGSISLAAGIFLVIFLRVKLSYKSTYIKIERKYQKIPLDSRIGMFFVVSVIMELYLDKVIFFYKPISIRQFLILNIVGVYSLYLIVNIHSVLRLLRDKEELSKQLKRSTVHQVISLTRGALKVKGTMKRELLVYASTILFGVSFCFILIGLADRNSIIVVLSLIYIIAYLLIVPINILTRAAALNNIINGTDAIASGDLDYFIEETGEHDFLKISQNINSMKESFKKSVESQLKSERLKTELITNVSHDLKTPLTSIINYVSLLKKDNIPQEQYKRYIDVLDKKTQRLKILIDDLFEASKVTSGAIELNIEKIDIASLLRQALGEFEDKISKSSLDFRVNIPVEEVNLNLDGKRTWRVFQNLISNVLKYSYSNSRVYIHLFEQSNKVVITIKNMSSYEMDFDVNEIFERFKRGEKARNTEGSGLGLSIAKSIVELQCGQMKIDIDGDLFKVTVEFKKNT
ncbi:sensor histidine kinase [Clostridium swellfunianum]|uniref:sensor histidine kinase n=1 Tax=Clostridium swellfunianum TaxID=1367462 RepID=UPI002030E634|nr:sensor histidine kinase [Clostridium swellfunianum]MCM0650211.1 sensor histidine kinase [Clostridium swellfunianum]